MRGLWEEELVAVEPPRAIRLEQLLPVLVVLQPRQRVLAETVGDEFQHGRDVILHEPVLFLFPRLPGKTRANEKKRN
jgi:hypothetical protein